jgi:CubicO group peptidase (beta-lactamase class C family)
MIGKKILFMAGLGCWLRLFALGQAPWADTTQVQADLQAIATQYGQPSFEWALVDAHAVAKSEGTFSSKQSTHRVGSIGKVIVAMGILRLVDAGQLQLEDPVSHYLPDLPLENPWAATDPVRIVHLLEHSSGLDDMHFNEYYAHAPDISLEMALAVNAHSKRIRWRPGTCSAYSNVGYAIAARVIEVIVQQPADVWLQDQVMAPLGMQDSYFEHWRSTPDTAHQAIAAGRRGVREISPDQYHYLYYPALGMVSSLGDMARLVRFLMGDGTSGGIRLLSEESMGRMYRHESTPAGHSQWHQGVRGLGFSLWGPADNPAVRAAGFVDGYIAQLCFLPGRSCGWLLLSTATDDDAGYIALVSERLDRTLPQQRWDPELTLRQPPQSAPQLGQYRYVSRRNALFAFYDDLYAGIDLRANAGGTTDYACVPWVGEYMPLTVIGNALGDWDRASGLIALAGKSRDDQDFLLIGDKYYERTDSPWPAIFRAAYVGYRAVAVAGLLMLLVTLVGRVMRAPFAMGALPTAIAANLPFWCGAFGFGMLQSDNAYDLGRLSAFAIGLLGLSLILLVTSLATPWLGWRWKAVGWGRFWKWLHMPLMLGNMGLTAYLIYYGMLPLATWWY